MTENKVRDPIPESFASYEEAGEFWDNRSTDDYEDLMREVEVEFDGRGHRFFVEVEDDLFWRAKILAKSRQKSLEEMIHQLLEAELAKVPAL
ncbi:MAG: BrnA antitoxin family protein [Caldilineaceae bacterium]|nr:BrnA antitoxin family protein [Caldilineaceae bacterium]